MTMQIAIIDRLPSTGEYLHLRKLAGWPVSEIRLTEKGLQGSLFGVCAVDSNNHVIGFGRVVGDGALYFHVQDVIVHPGHQRKGIGKMIMNRLLQYVNNTGGKNTNVGLMCSKGREKFYEELGFTARPNERFGAGMIRILH
jgi:GNAT superfamily N-acetyltransferase